MGKQHKLLDAHFITPSQEALVLQEKNILEKNFLQLSVFIQRLAYDLGYEA